MIVKLLVRLLVCVLILAGAGGYDLFRFLKDNEANITMYHESDNEEVELSLVDLAKVWWKNKDDMPVYTNNLVHIPVEEYEDVEFQDDNGDLYVCVDADNELMADDCTEGEGTMVYGRTWPLSFYEATYLKKFYIPHALAFLFLLMLLKDVFSAISEKAAERASSPKARQKEVEKIVAQVESLSNKGKHEKVIKILDSKETRSKLGREMEKLDLFLGRAQIATGDPEQGLNQLKKYARTFKDDEDAAKEIGQYFADNKEAARQQDLPFLLAYLEDNDDADFMKFVAEFALKHKAGSKGSLKGLIKICDAGHAPEELWEFILENLMKLETTDDVAMDFYESMKKKDPENAKPVLMLAEAKMASGDFDGALDELESLLNLDYENQRVHDMLFTIYQLKEKINDLYQIYNTILEQVEDEPIAMAQQRKIQQEPGFNSDLASSRQNLSLEELLAMRKDGDASVENDIMKKYERKLTIMFSDIKGYTRMTESQSPLETMQILQESDDIFLPIFKKHEGTLIKKIGDAFMARFDSADSALIACMQIQQAIHLNNKKREEAGKIRWEVRIGLNTGNVIVKDGDVYGDAVNVASRVESSGEANEVFCTEDTVNSVVNKKLQFQKRDLKKVKGKADAIQLYSAVFDLEGGEA
jgi:class 3 adenylate cyclase